MSNSLAYQILNEIKESYKKDQKFTDEVLQLLHSLYGEVLVRAIDLMESGKFALYQSENGFRKVIKVRGKSEEYTLFSDVNFCTCPAFKYYVLNTRKYLTCKHVLAAKLMQISNKIKTETYSSAILSEIIKNQIPEF